MCSTVASLVAIEPLIIACEFICLLPARLGVVNVLGIGVTTSELTEALVRFKVPYPFNVRANSDSLHKLRRIISLSQAA